MTPCGERFFSLGVNVLDGGYADREKDGKIWYSWKAFAPTLADWVTEARNRLSSWGFNSAGGWALPPETLDLPTIINSSSVGVRASTGSTRSIRQPKPA